MRLIAIISLSLCLSACSKSELTPKEVQAVQKTNEVQEKSSPAKPAVASDKGAAPAVASDKGATPSADEKKSPVANEVAPKAPLALKGTSYGSGVSLPESITIAELKANVDKYAGKEVRVEGLVSGVCPKRGCWFDMAGDKPGESMRFKVRDGVMVFPMEANGKYAVAQGKVRKMPMTLEQSKRWATYQRDSYGADIDPDKITEPLTIVRLDGSGAVIRDAK